MTEEPAQPTVTELQVRPPNEHNFRTNEDGPLPAQIGQKTACAHAPLGCTLETDPDKPWATLCWACWQNGRDRRKCVHQRDLSAPPCIRCGDPGHGAPACPVHCDPAAPCEACEGALLREMGIPSAKGRAPMDIAGMD